MATTFRIDYTRLLDLWRSIEQAGGRDKYIQAQLKEKGFLIERKPTDNMSKAELERYKKTLKEEAAERRRLAREAWQAYKAAHLVHLGEGVFWNDDLDHDKWDLPDAEESLAGHLHAIRPVVKLQQLGRLFPLQLRKSRRGEVCDPCFNAETMDVARVAQPLEGVHLFADRTRRGDVIDDEAEAAGGEHPVAFRHEGGHIGEVMGRNPAGDEFKAVGRIGQRFRISHLKADIGDRLGGGQFAPCLLYTSPSPRD